MTVSLHDDEAPFSLPPGYALHLLLVEDDAALSHALVQTLRTHHPAVHVITASSVEQALGALQAYAVTLIVTDIHLPGVQGITFIRRLRERGWHGAVIVMSGDGIEAVAETRELLQIFAVLAKPFEMTALVAAVGAALKNIPSQYPEERTGYAFD
jgi:DNA-binding response OmpR family regulator